MIVSRSSLDWTIVVPGHVHVSSNEKLPESVTFSGGVALAVETATIAAATRPTATKSMRMSSTSSWMGFLNWLPDDDLATVRDTVGFGESVKRRSRPGRRGTGGRRR